MFSEDCLNDNHSNCDGCECGICACDAKSEEFELFEFITNATFQPPFVLLLLIIAAIWGFDLSGYVIALVAYYATFYALERWS